MHRGTGSKTTHRLYIKWRSYRSYNLPMTNIAIINLDHFTAFQLFPWQANLDVFPPDYSSHDWLFRHISRTSPLQRLVCHWESLSGCLSHTSAFLLFVFSHQPNPPRHWPSEEEREMPLLSPGWQDRCWTVHFGLGGNTDTTLWKDESEIP